MKTVAQIAVVLISFVSLCLIVVGLAAAAGIMYSVAVDAFVWGRDLV